MTHQFELRERQSQPTLVIRTRSAVQDMPQVLGQAWGAIMHYAGQKGLQPSGPPFVAYHNMDMQDLDLEIGFPFAKKLDGAGEVLAGEIPGGKAAGCLHVGPYDQLPANARRYVEAIADMVDCPLSLISTSPDRDDNIVLRDIFA